MDLQFIEVYGDNMHDNDGTHLDGGIADDATWQSYWRQLVQCPSHLYDVPNGALGKRIITADSRDNGRTSKTKVE